MWWEWVRLDRDELASYFLLARYVYVVLFLVFLALVYRLRRPGALVTAAIVSSLYVFVVIHLPLERLWSLAPGHDRMFNLAMYATAATGHSPFEGWQVGTADLEPLWRAFFFLVSFGRPENAMAIYSLLPAAVLVLLPLSFYFGLSRVPLEGDSEKGQERRWELAFVAFALVLWSSSPLERFGVFQSFWHMNFLLKPNHAIALALLPGLVVAWTDPRPRVRILGGGAILVGLAWTFLVYWFYVMCGLAVYVGVAWWRGHAKRAREAIGTLAIALTGALPYVAFLASHYGWHRGGAAVRQLWYKPGYEAGFYDVFSVSLAHGALFFLSFVGVAGMAIRRLRRDTIWLALLAGAVLLWPMQLTLLAFERGGEPDELYFFTRFLLTLAAGVGAFFSLKLAGRLLRKRDRRVAAGSVAVLLLLTLPQTFPYWWHPPTMDRYYEVGLRPIPTEIRDLARWARSETSPDAVFVAESDLSTWIAALAGRRAFLSRLRPPGDYRERRVLERRLLAETGLDAVTEAHDVYGVTHLALDDAYLSSFGRAREDFAPFPWLEAVYRAEKVTVFALRLPSAASRVVR